MRCGHISYLDTLCICGKRYGIHLCTSHYEADVHFILFYNFLLDITLQVNVTLLSILGSNIVNLKMSNAFILIFVALTNARGFYQHQKVSPINPKITKKRKSAHNMCFCRYLLTIWFSRDHKLLSFTSKIPSIPTPTLTQRHRHRQILYISLNLTLSLAHIASLSLALTYCPKIYDLISMHPHLWTHYPNYGRQMITTLTI